MKHTIHSLIQGSPEWLSHRAVCNNASDAAAALGISQYKTRSALVREIATGMTPDIDEATQRRFDDGHRFEELARPLAEQIIGEDLYPISASITIESLRRPLSASLDGTTADDSTNFEHKMLNAALSAALDRGEIPAEYHPQMEQGMLINGATRCLFMASKWDRDGNLIDVKHAWYESNPALRANIVSAWVQVEEDAANYQHVEEKPAPVGAHIEALPALVVQVEGRVVSTNMDAFKAAAEQFIAQLPAADALQTDQDFADAEKAVKVCQETEDRLKVVKAQAQAQAISIDEAFRAIDDISAQVRNARLALDKVVKAEKENRKVAIIEEAAAELAAHFRKLNDRLSPHYIPGPIVTHRSQFAEAAKGLKTIASMRDKVSTALAHATIEANEIADRIEKNIRWFKEYAKGYEFLFPDLNEIVVLVD